VARLGCICRFELAEITSEKRVSELRPALLISFLFVLVLEVLKGQKRECNTEEHSAAYDHHGRESSEHHNHLVREFHLREFAARQAPEGALSQGEEVCQSPIAIAQGPKDLNCKEALFNFRLQMVTPAPSPLIPQIVDNEATSGYKRWN